MFVHKRQTLEDLLDDISYHRLRKRLFSAKQWVLMRLLFFILYLRLAMSVFEIVPIDISKSAF